MHERAPSADAARRFVLSAQLPPSPTLDGPALESVTAATSEAPVSLRTTEPQALVVGSELVAFAPGVLSTFREDLVNSTLLAQLSANEQVPDRTRIFDWYDVYFDALAQIGWSVEDRDFSTHVQAGQDFEAHAAIQRVLTNALGSGSDVLGLVKRTLEGMQAADDSRAVVLFHRETRTAQSAHFQVGAVEAGQAGEPFATLVAFSMQARVQTTQLLFLRSRTSDVTLRHCSSRIRIDPAVAEAVRGPLADRLATHSLAFVKAMPAL